MQAIPTTEAQSARQSSHYDAPSPNAGGSGSISRRSRPVRRSAAHGPAWHPPWGRRCGRCWQCCYTLPSSQVPLLHLRDSARRSPKKSPGGRLRRRLNTEYATGQTYVLDKGPMTNPVRVPAEIALAVPCNAGMSKRAREAGRRSTTGAGGTSDKLCEPKSLRQERLRRLPVLAPRALDHRCCV